VDKISPDGIEHSFGDYHWTSLFSSCPHSLYDEKLPNTESQDEIAAWTGKLVCSPKKAESTSFLKKRSKKLLFSCGLGYDRSQML
jgi:hypothetical protein